MIAVIDRFFQPSWEINNIQKTGQSGKMNACEKCTILLLFFWSRGSVTKYHDEAVGVVHVRAMVESLFKNCPNISDIVLITQR